VGINDLNKIKIVLPDITEQKIIITNLQEDLRKLDNLSKKSMQAINLMQERRTALISAVVTGKIDVRNWVAPDAREVEAEVSQEVTA
jgi:type I restriction enzyme S subunit